MMDLEIAFQELDFNKSPGHGQMLVHLSQLGRRFLLEIFNASWRAGNLPRDWKEALIIPIRKHDKRLMTSTDIDQSHLPASRANSWRGLSCVD
ncbi:hypothetical protein TNCT_513411, partial [Trichonephila clavata]